MSDDFDDNFKPGVQLNPLKGYEELRDVLDPVTGRMIGRYGITGMTIEEAAKNAEFWWDQKARYHMPDYKKDDDYMNAYGMKSGVLRGLPWNFLNRGERIAVIKQWHTHIGIPKHGMGFSQSQGKDYEKVIREIKRQETIRSFDLGRLFGPPDGEAQH